MWWSQFIDLFKFETSPGPSSLLNFGRANSAVLRLKCPRHSRICAVPELHAGVFTVILVCIPRKGAVLLAKSRNCLPLENIAGSFSEPRLVSRDIRFSWHIKSNTAFLFACLNLYFCDRRIHFRFRYLACLDRSSVLVPNFLHHQWIIAIYCRPCSVEFEAEMWLTA